jgi:hypothetical protein
MSVEKRLLAFAVGAVVAGCNASPGGAPSDPVDARVAPGAADGSVDGASAPGPIDGGMSSPQADAATEAAFPMVRSFEADACHDLDIAVSPDFVATATNSGHVVFYNRDGSVDHVHDFPGNTGDQHIVWDHSARRWFFSMMNTSSDGNSHMWLFASRDQQGNAWTSVLDVRGPSDMDNPNLTVTTDKVALLNLDCIYVVDKAKVLAGTSATVTPAPKCGLAHNDQIYGVDYGDSVPSTAYFVTMSDDQHINWISVEGTPAAGNLTVKQHRLSVSGFVAFPPFPGVVQQGGTHLRNSGVVAMWHRHHLWWSKAGKCGGVTCARMFDIDTDANVVDDFEFAVPNTYVWSAAPGIDRDGNLWALMSETSPSKAPSLAVGGRSVSGVVTAPRIVVQGSAPDVTDNGDWGDFFNCAQDVDDGSVWCLGNYGGVGPDRSCPTPAKVVHIPR